MSQIPPHWLQWANEIQAIGQIGLTYATGHFDRERYDRLRAIAAEILSHHSFESFEKIHNLLTAEKYYLTPKLDVRTAIIRDNQVLLVKESSDGKWTLPGGFAEVNESPADSAKREVFEETGFEVEIVKLYALIDKQKRNYPPQIPHTHKCFFLGKMIGGEAKPSFETSEIEFFARNKLPELSLHRTMAAEIELAFVHHEQGHLPTSFD